MHFPDWLDAVILGLVEGLTEFLPVSSTGHLLVVEQWLGFNSELFTVFIQMGALAAVWWLFRGRLRRMLPHEWARDPDGRRLTFHVIIAFLPAMFIGLATHHWIKEHLFSVAAIAVALIGGGIAIFLVERSRQIAAVHALEDLPFRLALLVGFGQCLALYPGVSRSGATIMVGLLVGLSRSAATEFSFLLAVPTMTAATVYELWKYRHELSPSMLELLAIGFLVAYGVAFVVVKWLIRFVQTHTFEGFAWYRIAAGVVLLALLSAGFFRN